MSRIGRETILFEKNVNITVGGDNQVIVKGGKFTQVIPVKPEIQVQVSEGKVNLTRSNDEHQTRAFHGLYRALIQNAVTGVSRGWSKELELNGVGYRAAVKGRVLELNLGYSHPIRYDIPPEIEIKVEKNTKVVVSGPSRELVGQVAANVRSYRPPEPFLGKGVKYSDEVIRRKAGKSAAK